MQLTYRGQAYSTSNNQIETVATEYIARFRRQSYMLCRPVKTVNSQLGIRKISRFCLWCLVRNPLHISKSKIY